MAGETQQHVWYWTCPGVLGSETQEGPISEKSLLKLASDGDLKLDTTICSPTRTKGQWIAAQQLPKLVNLIREGEQRRTEERKKAAEEQKQEAEAKRNAAAMAKVQVKVAKAKAKDAMISAKSIKAAVPDTSRETQRTVIIQRSGFHPQRVALLILGVLASAGVFLPWVEAPIIGSISGTAGDGWLALPFSLVAVACAVSGALTEPLRMGRTAFVVIASLVPMALGIWKIFSFMELQDAPDDPLGFSKAIRIGPGLYVMAIASALSIPVAIFYRPSGVDRN